MSKLQVVGDPRHPLLYRHHVESTLIALATVRPDVACAASRRAWGSELSPDALTLLDAIAADPRAAWLSLVTLANSEAEWRLADAALEVRLSDLTFHSIGSLITLARGRLHDAPQVVQRGASCEVAA